MPNQSSNQTSNSILTKLLEVDSELAATEAELLSRLESVQEKRRSLLSVISMFTTADTSSVAPIESPAPPPPTETNGQLEPVSSSSRAPSLEISKASTTDSVETSPQSNKAKKKASSPTRGNKNTQVKRPTKVAHKGSGWQDYMRDQFSQSSLPEAVYSVLQRSSEQVFEIPAIVNAIFMDELPKDLESKARRQVTNILSEGARKNKWYRGQLGQYSISRTVAKASSA